jgi:hypothetical protein
MLILVGITKGRDVPEFEKAVDATLSGFDKVVASYFPSYTARRLIRATFRNLREYTHLAILPDDLIVNQKAIDILVTDLQRVDYPVLCGCANLDMTPAGRSLVNVSLELPSPKLKKGTHHYNLMTEEWELIYSKNQQPIIVKYAGDPFVILRRDIVDKLSFLNDASYNGVTEDQGCCEDVVMSNELDKLGIPLYCDLRAKMLHLKISDADSKTKLQVGKKPSSIDFVQAVTTVT